MQGKTRVLHIQQTEEHKHLPDTDSYFELSIMRLMVQYKFATQFCENLGFQ